jgi:hypothetical protein
MIQQLLYNIKAKVFVIICVLNLISCNNISTTKNTSEEILSTVSSDSIVPNTENIVDMYKNHRRKNTQKFAFINKKGFTYKGKGGIVLIFPPNVFDCNDQDSIKIDICEYSDLNSIVTSNLSTMSNNKLLESNGMVYCKAYSNEKEIALKKGKSFKCMFNKPKLNGFKLFEGEEINGLINWKNPISEITAKAAKVNTITISKIEKSKKEALSICTYGTPNEINDIEPSIKFSKDSLSHILSYFFDNYDISYSDLIPFAPYESFIFNFTLTKNGRLLFKDSDTPISAKVRNKIIGYFDKMPDLKGYTNQATGIKEELPIYLSFCPNKILNERLENDQNNMSKVNQIIAQKESQEKERELEIEKKEKEARDKINAEYEIRQKNSETMDKIDESLKIVFNATKMGWINCDRFYNDKRKKVDLNFTDLDQYLSYNVQVIFPQIKSVYALNGDHTVHNIPVNESVKIIFVGMKNGSTYFYNKTIITEDVNEIAIVATKVKETDLNNYIENCLK